MTKSEIYVWLAVLVVVGTTLSKTVSLLWSGHPLKAIGWTILMPLLWVMLFISYWILYTIIASNAPAKSEMKPIHYNILAQWDVSPSTGAIYPPASTNRSSTVIVTPSQQFRTCPQDGPGAWSCNQRWRERKRNPNRK